MAFLFGLHNATETEGRLMMQRMRSLVKNGEFVGMADYIMKSFHDLLMVDLESLSDSNYSRGSHHPSQECFMAGTPEGHVERVHEGGVAPMGDLDDDVKEDAGATPCLWMEQLRAQRKKVEDA